MRAWLPRCKWVVTELLVWLGTFTQHITSSAAEAWEKAVLQNVLLQRGQQPAKEANPVSPSREIVWFKLETLELNSYHLLSNLCTMSWQQRSFPFQMQGCCWLRDSATPLWDQVQTWGDPFATAQVRIPEQRCLSCLRVGIPSTFLESWC